MIDASSQRFKGRASLDLKLLFLLICLFQVGGMGSYISVQALKSVPSYERCAIRAYKVEFSG